MNKEIISGLAHCCHHDRHWEYCYDYDERVRYIKRFKPRDEQKLRLKLFKIVPDDKLPGRDSPEWEAYNKASLAYDKAREAYTKAVEAYNKAWKAYDKASLAYDKAGEACDKAWKAYDKAWEAYNSKFVMELDTLHSEMFPECTWNGNSIFAYD